MKTFLASMMKKSCKGQIIISTITSASVSVLDIFHWFYSMHTSLHIYWSNKSSIYKLVHRELHGYSYIDIKEYVGWTFIQYNLQNNCSKQRLKNYFLFIIEFVVRWKSATSKFFLFEHCSCFFQQRVSHVRCMLLA